MGWQMPSQCRRGGDTEAREQKKRGGHNTPSAFETSKNNSCNLRLKAVETLENILMKHLKNTHKTHLKTIATIRKHPNRTHATYVYNIFNIQINTAETYIWKNTDKTYR
jgi:ribosomal protein L16/L10AE